MRGAVSDGYQQAAEGFYNILGTLLGRNPHSNTPTQDLRIQLRIAEQHLAVENAAIKERLKRQPRGFAPPPDYGKLKDQIRSILDELNYRQGDGESFVHTARSFLESTQAEAASQRQASRDYFHVDKEFAESAAGKILQGVGGLATLPLYGVPVLGPSTTISQVYQQGFDDYVQSREEQGKPIDWEEADRAAKTYLITAGPAEVLLDKLIVGKLLKGAVGKSTVGELRRRLGIIIVAGGFTNASQQAWLNVIAKELQGYDPERPFTKGVLESVFYGGLLAGIGGSASHYFTHDTTPIRKFHPEKRDRRGERGMAIVPWDKPEPGGSQKPDDRAGASQSAPNTNESDGISISENQFTKDASQNPADLDARARELHEAWPDDGFRHNKVTSVLEVLNPDGTTSYIISSSERHPPSRQIEMLRENESPAMGDGHAEATAINLAISNDQVPLRIGTSAPICRDCGNDVYGLEIASDSPFSERPSRKANGGITPRNLD